MHVYLHFIVQNGGGMLRRRSADLEVNTRCWLVVDLGEDERRTDLESYLEKCIERDQILTFD